MYRRRLIESLSRDVTRASEAHLLAGSISSLIRNSNELTC